MRNETIKLVYIKDSTSYHTKIDRALFMDQMQRYVIWYAPDNNNSNAQKLCTLIPEIDTITIHDAVIDTQDIPFFEYTTYSNPEPNILKLRRPYRVIWETLKYYWDIAVAN